MVGIESASDPDFGGEMIVVDIGIFRILIKFFSQNEV